MATHVRTEALDGASVTLMDIDRQHRQRDANLISALLLEYVVIVGQGLCRKAKNFNGQKDCSVTSQQSSVRQSRTIFALSRSSIIYLSALAILLMP